MSPNSKRPNPDFDANRVGEALALFAHCEAAEISEDHFSESIRQEARLDVLGRARNLDVAQINQGLSKEIVAHQYTKALLEAENIILEMICAGVSLKNILESLSKTVEEFSCGGLCSIVIMDKDEPTRTWDVAPSLPDSFVQIIRKVECSSDAIPAFLLKQQVSVEGIVKAPGWKHYRDVELAHDIRSSWSTPIQSKHGKTLGTLTLYYRTPPTKSEEVLANRAIRLATIAFERNQVETQLHYLATHDPLTGLPNRHLFEYSLKNVMARARRNDSMFALIFIDLDRFKNVNDQFGHDCGDELLKYVAHILTGCFRMQDTVARLGGDEFTIIVEEISHMDQIKTIGEKLIDLFSPGFHIAPHDFPISCSIGAAVYPLHGLDSTTLLKNADTAMYQAKKFGRNNFQMYAPSISDYSAPYGNIEPNNTEKMGNLDG
jgi:diguanylate cyclase (GGDEF)-like protein